MNRIWSGMMLVGIVYGILTGRVVEVSEALLSSAREAVTLCVAMRFLFPAIPDGHPALEHITTNCVANLLGLGSASTVYGLKAMEALEMLKRKIPLPDGTASDEMCDFLILNISSLQLIPVTIIAYRSQYGSVNPTAIVGPGIAATAVSTGVAIAFCKIRRRLRGCGSDNVR